MSAVTTIYLIDVATRLEQYSCDDAEFQKADLDGRRGDLEDDGLEI